MDRNVLRQRHIFVQVREQPKLWIKARLVAKEAASLALKRPVLLGMKKVSTDGLKLPLNDCQPVYELTQAGSLVEPASPGA